MLKIREEKKNLNPHNKADPNLSHPFLARGSHQGHGSTGLLGNPRAEGRIRPSPRQTSLSYVLENIFSHFSYTFIKVFPRFLVPEDYICYFVVHTENKSDVHSFDV